MHFALLVIITKFLSDEHLKIRSSAGLTHFKKFDRYIEVKGFFFMDSCLLNCGISSRNVSVEPTLVFQSQVKLSL